MTEGLNSKIQSIKSAARGFHNFQNYRIRILFFCGKLNLYPLLSVKKPISRLRCRKVLPPAVKVW